MDKNQEFGQKNFIKKNKMDDFNFRELLAILLVVVCTVLIVAGYERVATPILVGITLYYFGSRIIKKINGKKN